MKLYLSVVFSVLQDGSDQGSVKREQSAAIDIPSPQGSDATLNETARNRRDMLDSSKSADSTPKGTPKDTPPKSGDNDTPPSGMHSPIPEPGSSSMPESGLSVFERRYSEPVAIGGELCGGEQRGDEEKEDIVWNRSEQQLDSSSLPNPSVAIQIEVCVCVCVCVYWCFCE